MVTVTSLTTEERYRRRTRVGDECLSLFTSIQNEGDFSKIETHIRPITEPGFQLQ